MKDRVDLFIQNYLSNLVSYDDDDNFMNFFSYIQLSFKLNERDAMLLALKIISCLMKLKLLTFVDIEYVHKKDINNYIRGLIKHLPNPTIGSGWFDYYKPTTLCCELINKYQLYDGYYDNTIVCVDFLDEKIIRMLGLT